MSLFIQKHRHRERKKRWKSRQTQCYKSNDGDEKTRTKKRGRLECWKRFQEDSCLQFVLFVFVSMSLSDISICGATEHSWTNTFFQHPWAGCLTDEHFLCNGHPQSNLAQALAPEEWRFQQDLENLIRIRSLELRRAGHVTVTYCP